MPDETGEPIAHADGEASEQYADDSPSTPNQATNPELAPPKRVRSNFERRSLRGVIVLSVLVLLLSGAIFGYVIYRNGQIGHIDVKGEVTVPNTGIEDILLVGSTSRCALDDKQAGAFGSCSQGVTGVNSDVIMILRLNPTNHRVTILSIPRDTFLPNARPSESNRIDSALAYGPTQLVTAVQDDLGIPINHYIELNFDTFQDVVKALGGLKMYFPYPVKDPDSGLLVTKAGCQPLGKFMTLALVRARHMSYKVKGQWVYDGSGDLGRILRDHEFLRVLASAVAKRGLGNPLTDNGLIGAIAPNLTVDSSFSIRDMVDLTLTYRGIDPNSAPQTTLPVVVDTSFDYMFKGYNYGSIVFPSEPQDTRTIQAFMGQQNAGSRLKPKSITVQVEGGISQPADTSATAKELSELGYRIASTKEVASVGPVSETQVLYTPGHLAQGERVQNSLTGAVALGEGPTNGAAEVTVITGSDYTVRAKAVTSTKSSTGAKLTSNSNNSVGTTAALDAVLSGPLSTATTSNQSLPFYDPRACPIRRVKH